MEPNQVYQLKQLLSKELNLDVSNNLTVKKMSGGAIQENWLIKDNSFALVLRKNAETSVSVSSDREQEYLLLSRLYELGIKVPKPYYFQKYPNFLNSEFFIMEKISGLAEGHKLVRIPEEKKRQDITEDIARTLAHIHKIESDSRLTELFDKPDKDDYLKNKLQYFKSQLDLIQNPRPILEYAISWMASNLPKVDNLVLIHGDFRIGNIMIEDDHVSGVLDWEFAQWGDRREDIGWLTAKCWRFGQDDYVSGGIGSYKSFAKAYAEVCDVYIPEFELKFWHVLSHVRWAIIAIQQSNRNNNMKVPSLELALTQFMVPGLEKNILDILGDKI